MLLIKASARFPDLVQRAELEANIEWLQKLTDFEKDFSNLFLALS